MIFGLGTCGLPSPNVSPVELTSQDDAAASGSQTPSPPACPDSTLTLDPKRNLSAVYLALSLPPVVYPTRMAMNQWLPGDRTKKKIYRKVLLLVIIIGFALAIAMSWCARSCLLNPGPCSRT